MSVEFEGYEVYCDGRPACRTALHLFGEPGDDWDDVYKALERLGWRCGDDDGIGEETVCPECVKAAAEADSLAAAGHIVDENGGVLDQPLFGPRSMTAPLSHSARVVRRFRHGAWTPMAMCACGWEMFAASEKHAATLAGEHNMQRPEQ